MTIQSHYVARFVRERRPAACSPCSLPCRSRRHLSPAPVQAYREAQASSARDLVDPTIQLAYAMTHSHLYVHPDAPVIELAPCPCVSPPQSTIPTHSSTESILTPKPRPDDTNDALDSTQCRESNVTAGTRLAVEMLDQMGAEATETWKHVTFIAAVGEYRTGHYASAKNRLRSLLIAAPGHRQAASLLDEIEERIVREGLIGAGVLAGGAIGLGILAGMLFGGKRG